LKNKRHRPQEERLPPGDQDEATEVANTQESPVFCGSEDNVVDEDCLEEEEVDQDQEFAEGHENTVGSTENSYLLVLISQLNQSFRHIPCRTSRRYSHSCSSNETKLSKWQKLLRLQLSRLVIPSSNAHKRKR
jgi:hypothetical protein